MAKDYYTEYCDSVNQILNQLFQLQLKFMSCKNEAQYDYGQGILTKEQFDYINGLSIITYDERVNPKYMLTKDEMAFVKEYGDLNSDNVLMNDLIKKKYISKRNLLENIFKAIRIFFHFETLDEEGRKDLFIKIVDEDCNNTLVSYTKSIEGIKNSYGKNYYSSVRYQKLSLEMKRIQDECDELVSKIRNASYSEFLNLVAKFYDIKVDYFKWFRRLFLKNEYGEALETFDSSEELSSLETGANVTQEQCVSLVKKTSELSDLSMHLTEFTMFANNVPIPVKESKKKFSLFKKHDDSYKCNKDELYEIFEKFMENEGFQYYLNSFKKEENPTSYELFERYFDSIYGQIIYVDLDLFKRRLILEVLSYYNSLIVDLKGQVEANNDTVTKTISLVKQRALNIRQMEQIRNYYPTNEEECRKLVSKLVVEGLSPEEQLRVYESLKESLASQYGREYFDGPVLDKKVGN